MNENSFPEPEIDAVPYRETGPDRTRQDRLPVTAFLLLCCVVPCGVLSPPLRAEEAAAPMVSGRVLGEPVVEAQQVGEAQPVSAAEVYAYDVATYALNQVTTDQKGQFLFQSLPAGLYKIIAHKEGFVPAVELLLRRRADASQFLVLHLVEEAVGDVRAGESYWETRASIPADVMRQIRQLGLRQASAEPGLLIAGATGLQTRLAAQGGVADLGEGYGQARLTGAAVDVHGSVGGMDLALDGRFLELTPTGAVPGGEVTSVSVSLEDSQDRRMSLVTSAGEAAEVRGGETVPVDLKHVRLSWSGAAAGGTSDMSAKLVDESNFYGGGAGLYPDLPATSRTLSLEGSYSRDLTSATSLTTGLSYSQRQGSRLLGPDGTLNDEVVGAYGVAGSQVRPRVLVEYGLFSSLREGGLSLMPHGGIVVSLGGDWKARTSFSQRFDHRREEGADNRFDAAFFDDRASCRQSGEACYEVTFARGAEGEEDLSIGAIHREFAEPLRLYFSDDFFNRLESLLMVPGDELPELQFRMVRRISPKVLAKLESNIASGGGGIFYATDEMAYENRVRYLVTSLDTHFQNTATGVFVAFHYLEQAFKSVMDEAGSNAANELEIQRLQLMLTQDLSALADILPNLAVRFNMELSRGATPYTLTDDELHKKLMGGISVSY
jgi:hypothetical protein